MYRTPDVSTGSYPLNGSIREVVRLPIRGSRVVFGWRGHPCPPFGARLSRAAAKKLHYPGRILLPRLPVAPPPTYFAPSVV